MSSVNSDIKRYARNVGQNWYHVVLTPKARCTVFQWKTSKEIAERAFDIVCQRHNILSFFKEVMDDHVHLFIECPPDMSVRKLLRIIKGGSSFLIRREKPSLRKYKHLWVRGTMYRSVGTVTPETVRNYIDQSNNWSKATQKRLID